MTLNDFHYGLTLANELYDIEMQDNNYEEIALIAFGQIGNKRCKLYHIEYNLDSMERSIELPCNCETIEAVTTAWEDWNNVSNQLPNGDLGSAFTENYIETRKIFKDKLYLSGKFVKYEQVGNTLYLNGPYPDVHILYYGLEVDDVGLPRITDEEAYALATYVAATQKFKEGMKTNNQGSLKLAEILENKWKVRCDQARCAYIPSQNDMDEILDAKTSWNRKLYGKTYKPIQ